MRRLTLILSDLYLPQEDAPRRSGRGARAEYVALPQLEWLLRFARHGRPIEDWRSALATEVGCADLARVAPARFAARGRVPADRIRSSWFATPAYLEARLDHVRLYQRGLLRISAGERSAWCEEFARSFGPEFALHDAGTRGFILSGLDGQNISTLDPARVLGADIAASLAHGADVAALRRISAEIEMWLHGAVLNRERERARVPRISSLWLWGGGGALDEAPDIAPDPLRFYAGEDPWLAALARAQTVAGPLPAPQGLGDFQPPQHHGIVELAPMGEPGGLTTVDDSWLRPARVALARGALEQVEVVANDRYFTTRRHGGWRFWRRPRHWMDLLRRSDNSSQA